MREAAGRRSKRCACLAPTIAAAALVAAVLLAAVGRAMIAVALDPYRLVRAEFTRQRIAAGLSRDSVEVAGHRWVYAYSDDGAAGRADAW